MRYRLISIAIIAGTLALPAPGTGQASLA